jgi:repressor of nif and glnA expression
MKVATKPSEALKILWKERIFLKPNKIAEVMKELEKRGYNFNEQAIHMALKRAKYLTQKGKKGNYTYVQKYPYINEKQKVRE